MKKLAILGLMVLTSMISLGVSLPTYATTQTNAAPTYNDINRAVSQLKSTGQYYEYANLIQDLESGYTFRIEDDLLTIDSSLNLNNKTYTELVNIAKSLPNYGLYAYLYGLITYTENWLPNYYSASTDSQKEAYNAINDAVIACRYLIKNPSVVNTTATTTNTTTATTLGTTSRITTSTATDAANATTAAGTANKIDSQTTEATATPPTTSIDENQTVAVNTPATDTTTTSGEGTTISVTVLPHDEDDQATQNTTDNASNSANQSNVATNLTYAATATSLAGAMLATKREVKNKNRRF